MVLRRDIMNIGHHKMIPRFVIIATLKLLNTNFHFPAVHLLDLVSRTQNQPQPPSVPTMMLPWLFV